MQTQAQLSQECKALELQPPLLYPQSKGTVSNGEEKTKSFSKQLGKLLGREWEASSPIWAQLCALKAGLNNSTC